MHTVHTKNADNQMGGPQFKGVFCPVILLSCELSVSPCKVASLAHQSPTGFVVFLLLCVLALSIVPSLVLGTGCGLSEPKASVFSAPLGERRCNSLPQLRPRG